jgi:hypothetical protein
MPDHAIPGNTPINQPPGPLVVPGRYELVLTVDGRTFKQPLTVTLDPRVQVSQADLEAQLALAKSIDEWMNISFANYNEISVLRTRILQLQKHPESIVSAADLESFKRLEKPVNEILDGTSEAPGFGSVNRDLARYVTMIQGGDMRPPQSAVESATLSCRALKNALNRWGRMTVDNLTELNGLLGRDDASRLVRSTNKDLICPN